MLTIDQPFSSFAVKDTSEAVAFYRDTLGLDVGTQDGMPGFVIRLGAGGVTFVYEKPDHEPAVFTVFNLGVSDVDAAVDALNERGVVTKIYDDDALPTDEKGIARGFGTSGTSMAWFRDPSGNVVAVGQLDDVLTA